MQQTKDLQKRKYLDVHKLNSAFFIDSANSIMFCRWCFILAIFIFAIENAFPKIEAIFDSKYRCSKEDCVTVGSPS